jgi:hypothetical protein
MQNIKSAQWYTYEDRGLGNWQSLVRNPFEILLNLMVQVHISEVTLPLPQALGN